MSDDPLIGRTFAQRYRIDGLLGRGGMGAVYRATQTAIERIVAIKVLRADAVQPNNEVRFRREAIAVSALDHPNTIRVLDYGHEESTDQLYIVMEFIEGDSLGEVLRREKRLPLERVLRIVRQILKSLGEAHVNGTLHRDLKPDNVMLSQLHGEPDFVKVVDFGIAKVLRDNQTTDLTKTGQVLGTPRYMSPEQAQGLKLDGRSDLYALATMMYKMLSGKTPFDRPNPMLILMDHIKTPSPPLPALDGVPPEIGTFLARALSKSPEDRPASAEAFRTELEAAVTGPRAPTAETVALPPVTGEESKTLARPSVSDDPTVSAEPSQTGLAAPPTLQRAAPWTVFAALLIGVAIIVAAVLLRPDDREEVGPKEPEVAEETGAIPDAPEPPAGREEPIAVQSEPGPLPRRASDIAARVERRPQDEEGRAPAADRVSVRLLSTPAGATVRVGDRTLHTPCEVSWSGDAAAPRVRVEKRGYHSKRVRLLAGSPPVHVRLERKVQSTVPYEKQ